MSLEMCLEVFSIGRCCYLSVPVLTGSKFSRTAAGQHCLYLIYVLENAIGQLLACRKTRKTRSAADIEGVKSYSCCFHIQSRHFTVLRSQT